MCNLTSGGTTTQTNALPSWAQSSIQSGLQGALGTFGSSTFSNYPGQLAADANPAMTTAANQTQGLTGFNAPQVTPGSVASTNLSPYENPYTQSVVDTTNNAINMQLGQQLQANDGQAAMAGAFGGDRAAITNTQSQYNANQVLAQTDAGLNQSNFTNAENMATGDLNRSMQGQEANMQGAISSNAQNLQANQDLFAQGSGLTSVAQNADTLGNQQYRESQLYPIQMAQDGVQAISQDSGVLGDELTRQTIAPNASTLGTVAGLGTTATGLLGLLGGSGTGLLGSTGSSSNGGLLGLLGLGASGSTALTGTNSGGLLGTLGITGNGASSIAGSGLDGAAQTAASGYGSFSGITSGGDSSIGSDILGDDLTGLFARGGLVGYADGGLVDDPGYVPVAATDGMLTIDQQGNVVTPFQERTAERYATPGSMMPLPSTSAATSDGQGWSQDQSGLGALGLEGARVGYADGGDVDGQWVPSPDGGLVFLPADPGAATAPSGLASAAAPPAVNLQLPPAVPLSASQSGYDQYVPPQPDGSPSGAVPTDSSAPAPAPAPAPDAGTADPGSGIAAAILGDGGSQAPAGATGIAGDILGSDPGSAADPSGGAPAPTVDRLQRSADPAAPLPGGQATPAGLAAAAPPSNLAASSGPQGAAPPQVSGPQGIGPQGNGPSGAGAPGQSSNSWALPVLAAGLGMLSNAGPNAAKMIGGGLAGVQVIEQQREADLRRQQLQQQMAYQNGMLGVRGAGVAVQQQKADTGASRAASQDQVNQQRVQLMQQQGNLAASRAVTAAQGRPLTMAQLQQNVIQDLMTNQGMSQADAYQVVSGQGIKQQLANAASDRADAYQQGVDQNGQNQQATQTLKQQQVDAMQGNRALQAQQHATDAEDKGARSLMYAASNAGKTLSYSDAINQVRTTRLAAGPAPVQTPPGQPQPGAVPAASAVQEGATATGPGGTKVIFRGGSWQPLAKAGF